MPSPRLIDYHLHTAVTVDGRMSEVQACERAVALGIQEIAFTNHVMLKQPNYLTSPEAFVSHWQKIESCRQRYPQLKIRLGIEMDYYPGWEEKIAATLQAYQERIGRSFDLVLGAIHEMHGIFFSNQQHAPRLYQDRDVAALYRDYFTLSVQAVQSGLFDIIAHADLIKKHTHELAPPIPFKQYCRAVEPFVEALLDTEVGIEVNTKGLKLKVAEAYPSVELLGLYLSRARSRGLEPILIMGSDAHVAEDVGGCLEEAVGILKDLGQGTVTSFEGRRRSPFEIGLPEAQARVRNS